MEWILFLVQAPLELFYTYRLDDFIHNSHTLHQILPNKFQDQRGAFGEKWDMLFFLVEIDSLAIGYIDVDEVGELHMGLELLAIGKIAHYDHIGCNFYTKYWK